MRENTKRREVRQDRPCAVCGGIQSCSVGTDGLIMCRRRSGPQPGFSYHGQATKDPQWALYRASPGNLGNGTVNDPPPHAKITGRKGNAPNSGPALPWLDMAREYAAGLDAQRRSDLASHLGLPCWALEALPLLGANRDTRLGWVWTFPEVDGQENVIGINRRTAGGKQQVVAKARRGLTVPRGWDESGEPVYLVEGASDVLALAALGLVGIGRPSCRGGIEELHELLATLKPARQIVVLGEWDARPDGSWPGRDGALFTAQQLSARLKREVFWAMVPDGKKDVRQWGVIHPTPVQDQTYWHAQGQVFVSRLQLQPIRSEGIIQTGSQLALRCFDTVEPAVMHWSVPGYFPQGELVLLAGDGGEGKSLITLHIASRLTRGQPCFGLTYTPPGPQHVLLACCEDDSSTTTKPRLLAAGADLRYVHEIQGITDKDGKPAPFGLGHVEQIGNTLKRLGGVGLVVIDPVTAYLGVSGVDDGKDVEIRTLLEPLRVAVRGAGTLCLLVKHFNKTVSPKASARIAGAAGWRNAARASYLVLPDPTLPGRKLFLPDKLNGAALPSGLQYRPSLPTMPEVDAILQSLPSHWPDEDRLAFRSQLARVEWLGETDLDADSVCAEQTIAQVDANLDNDRAAAWLKKALAEQPMRGVDVVEDGNSCLEIVRDMRWWRDRILKGRVGGQTRKARTADGAWYFCLPHQQPPADVEETAPRIEESEESEESEETKNLRGG